MKWIYQQFSDGSILVKTAGKNPYHDGIICEVRIWNTPLSNTCGIDRAKLIASAPSMKAEIAKLKKQIKDLKAQVKRLGRAKDIEV